MSTTIGYIPKKDKKEEVKVEETKTTSKKTIKKETKGE